MSFLRKQLIFRNCFYIIYNIREVRSNTLNREESNMLTVRQIENRVNKIQELEAQKKAHEEQINTYKDELKEELAAQSVEELMTPHFTIRWKVVTSNKFDTSALKIQMPDVYKAFLKANISKRFTIA